MNLVLAARDVDSLRQVAQEVESLGSTAYVQPTDVTEPADCKRLIDQTLENCGSIDFLILNAGRGMWVRFDEITDQSVFKQVMETNYFGAVNCIYPALPHLRRSGGTIVSILSLQAVVGVPDHTAYTASKHALKGFLDALELEVGDEVRFLSILPGWISGTNLRANAFKGKQGAAPRHDRQAVSVERCSAIIIHAMESGQREVYIPSKLKYLCWTKHIFPGLLRWIILRAIEKQRN